MNVDCLYPVILAIGFHVLDFITGLVAALKTKSLDSSKMRDGLFKKVGFIFCYLLSVLVDTQGRILGLDIGVKILPIIVVYAVGTEIVSIIENICKINPDLIAEKLKEFFELK